jgi:CheY-specific phosphatase CheX
MPDTTPTTRGDAPLDPGLLARLAIEALERTAFVLADPASEPESLPVADTFAQIDFSGPEKGGVDLFASRAFARNLAASILGCDPGEVSDAQAEEALRELANILGGSVIRELGGENCQFSLGLPRVGAREQDGATACVLDAEGERLEIRCHYSHAA